MDFLITFLMVLETLVCLLLIFIVLMQRPRQEGLGAAFGSGMTDQMFGAQTTNVLQKGTTWLGIAFFVLTFLLAILVAHNDKLVKGPASLVDEADKGAKPLVPANMPANIEEMLQKLKTEEAAKAAPDAPKADAAAPSATVPVPAPAVPEVKPTAPATETPATPAPESKAPALTPPATVPATAPTPPPAVTPEAPAPKTGN